MGTRLLLIASPLALLLATACDAPADSDLTPDGKGDELDSDADLPEVEPPAPLFSAEGVRELRFEADFETAFAAAHAGAPDGIFPPTREKLKLPGTVSYVHAGQLVTLPSEPGATTDDDKPLVEFKVRGNSSLQECSFPKLKLKVREPARNDSPFASSFEIKIGTHCGDDNKPGTIGRLRNEKATWREALAYRIAALADIPTPKTANIVATYVQSGTGEETERQALVFEHQDEVARRLGGKALDDIESTFSDDPFEVMDTALLARLHFSQALLGNWDWDIGERSPTFPLWNVDAISFDDGTIVPLAGDYDLASIVTGDEPQIKGLPADFLPGEDDPQVLQAANYLSWKSAERFSEEDIAGAVAHFQSVRAEIEAAVADAQIDDEGRELAAAHVAAFYAALERIDEIL